MYWSAQERHVCCLSHIFQASFWLEELMKWHFGSKVVIKLKGEFLVCQSSGLILDSITRRLLTGLMELDINASVKILAPKMIDPKQIH